MFNWLTNNYKVLSYEEEAVVIPNNAPTSSEKDPLRTIFIQKFLRDVGACLVVENGYLPLQVKFDLAILGSIYDLQQQIAELQEKIDERS